MSDIFLSYKSEDKAKAQIIAEALEQKGYSVWWDKVIPPGRTFDDVIEENLDASKCVVVLWSEKSVKSKWVITEAGEGDSRGILIPVLINEVKPPLAFRRIEAAKLIDWDGSLSDEEFELLLGSIEGMLDVPTGIHESEIQDPDEDKPTMPILEILASNAVATVAKFLIEKVVEYMKKSGSDKEVETLKNQLEQYKEKTQLMENELEQFKEIATKLETKMGSSYTSEIAFVNWNFDNIKPESSAFEIKVWTEKGDYQKGTRDISIVPKSKNYRIGDKINLYFRSEKDCYLTLLNYGTTGNMTVLLPNGFSQDNFIQGGKTYAIPGEEHRFDYILSGPPGIERIKAIGTTTKMNLMDLKFNNDEIFKTSSAAARDISVVSKKMESAGPQEWAVAMCEFEVN